MNKIETSHVYVHLEGRKLLDDISIKIKPNSITACIGPQGCGKGAFLRLFNRLSEYSGVSYQITGEIKLDLKNVLDLPVQVLRRRVGMLFKEPCVFPGSVYDNVAFGLRVHGVRHKKFISDVVERSLIQTGLFSQLKDKLQSVASALDLTQRQLLCLARTLALEPTAVLLEEPTANLDTMSAYRMEELIYTLKSNYTVLVSTNSAQQASRISDYTAFFYQGELIEHDETSRIFTNPLSSKTENYITGRFT